jgi:hypothetical protein
MFETYNEGRTMTAPEPRARNAEVVNPLRDEQRQHIRDELEAWLRHRYVPLFGTETDEEVLSIVNALERFEAAVIAAGGDLMVDSPESSEPEHPEYVIPRRRDDEAADAYVARVHFGADRVSTRI